MSIPIIEEAKIVRADDYCLEFDGFNLRADGQYSFDCNKNGEVNINSLPKEAQKNYFMCISSPDRFSKHIAHYTRKWREPARAICKCGKEIFLENEFMGACSCPYCDRWYNMFGQELNPPELWEDDEDDEDYWDDGCPMEDY